MAAKRKRSPPPPGMPQIPAAVGPRPRGRTLFCEEVAQTIVQWLRLGNFRESAAARARVSPDALGSWIKKGREEIEAAEAAEASGAIVGELSEFADFYLRVIEAEAESEQTMLGLITIGDNEDRRWFLERRYPHRWGKLATRVELSGPNGQPIEVSDARRALLGRLLPIPGSEGAAPGDHGSESGAS